MVKFGGHLEAFIEGDNRGTSLYVVPYNTIKDLIFQEGPSTEFLSAWNASLSSAEDDFRLARKALWERIFKTVAEKCPPLLRGAHPGNALKVYVENSHADQAQETLARMNKMHAAASINTEALRKLVKKFDKYRDRSESLSLTLLPALYTSSLYSSQNMLQDGIALVRGLLDKDDSFVAVSSMMIRHDSEARHQEAVAVRMDELDWLKRLVASIPPDDLLPKLVAHRGFHHIKDRNDKRPLENSLSAYEMAWTSGIHLCECDVAMTRDEKLVLAHDENFLRLALDDKDPNSHKNIGQLTFRQLISMPLKSGVRPPLLVDVLRSAIAISENSKLVIEVKPGNEAAASALARLLIRHPDLRQAVAMIMSFDANAMHRLRSELSIIMIDDHTANNAMSSTTAAVGHGGGMYHHRVTSFDHFGTMTNLPGSHHRLSSMDNLMASSIGLNLSLNNLHLETSIESSSPPDAIVKEENPVARESASSTSNTLPKLMLLTVSGAPHNLCEQHVSVDDLSPIENWLKRAEDGSLDGVYLQFEHKMMTEEGAERLRQLSERFHIGVWTRSGKDPDDYQTFEWLTRQCHCTFVNTDLPNHFRKEIFVRNSSSSTRSS